MPIYEYACAKCEHVFEARLERSSDPQPACPDCGAHKVKKLISAFAVANSTPGFEAPNLPPCQGGPGPGCGMGPCGL